MGNLNSNLSATEMFKNTKRQLDVISPTMCAAKWQQVTIHLANGTTHSCHHPRVHTIPLEELENNPSALHNTQHKKEMRKQMLNGERPEECDYCWRVEDSPKGELEGEVFSDRIVKSSETWAAPHLQQLKNMPWTTNVNPSYMEVDFDTTCNFKCAYCSPLYSTTWMQEIKSHGPYRLPSMVFNSVDNLQPGKGLPILQSESNPYIDAFWQWWPDAVRHIHTFRITGGEPLLSKNTFKMLDFLIDNPQPQMEFNINSNLGAPKEIVDKFIEKIAIIQDKKAVKEFKLFTSNEAHGKRAEYIRFGLDYDYWLGNVDRILSEVPDSRVTMMSTFNLLSVTSYLDFLKDMLELKLRYSHQTKRQLPLAVDVPYLRHPNFLAAWVLTENYLSYIEECVTFMYKNQEFGRWYPLATKGFFEHEIHRMERLYYLVSKEMGVNKPENIEQRRNFAAFVDEYDSRRGTNFMDTFPELVDFYHFCKV
jgi:organic radical activating enzyme